jgi:thiamine-phosphate pyrophosphorylase
LQRGGYDGNGTSRHIRNNVYCLRASHEQAARFFLEGGVRIIQYREKGADTRTMIREASAIRELCRRYGAVFIVDDRIDVAMAAGADGLHIGQDDLPLSLARKLLPGKIIGVSAKTAEQAREAETGGASYLGVGTIFPTATKVKTTLIGLGGFGLVRSAVSLPVFCIGGLKLEHSGS